MNDRSYDSDSSGGTAGIGLFLIGAVCGAGLALLLAPAAGGDTRRKLGETARKLGSRASEVVGRIRDTESGSDSRSGQDQTSEPYRSGSRREPLAGGRAKPGVQGTDS